MNDVYYVIVYVYNSFPGKKNMCISGCLFENTLKTKYWRVRNSTWGLLCTYC